MSQLSQFLKRTDSGVSHYCPGCQELHNFRIFKSNYYNNSQWNWDGNIIYPTFTPNMEIIVKDLASVKTLRICHYSIVKGKIYFFPDCTHQLKGLTIDLPALPNHYRDERSIYG